MRVHLVNSFDFIVFLTLVVLIVRTSFEDSYIHFSFSPCLFSPITLLFSIGRVAMDVCLCIVWISDNVSGEVNGYYIYLI